MSDNVQLKGDLETLKHGDFETRTQWFHAEFSEDIEKNMHTWQQLMYFWAASRTYFKAWLFKKIGRNEMCSELVQEARNYIALMWGNGDGATKALEDVKTLANNMVMCHERLEYSEKDERYIETFSTDDNPKDFRSAICRTLKEFADEKDMPDLDTRLRYTTIKCSTNA